MRLVTVFPEMPKCKLEPKYLNTELASDQASLWHWECWLLTWSQPHSDLL